MDKILKSADEICIALGASSMWLSRDRAIVVKILKELVEGVQNQTNNNARDEICPKCGNRDIDISTSGNRHCTNDGCYYWWPGKLSPVA